MIGDEPVAFLFKGLLLGVKDETDVRLLVVTGGAGVMGLRLERRRHVVRLWLTPG